jgi:hypothetical protein
VGALADIIRRHGPAYVQRFGERMPSAHRHVLRDLARCRTPQAGGQLWHCPQCQQPHYAYHSCGNRHCPACGADDARGWHDRQAALRLPVSYFLCTCTVPEPLRKVIRSHPQALLPALFQASSSALVDLCLNPKWFGAMPGITAMLHTWTRAIAYHPHIHYLVTGGGLNNTGAWRWSKTGFLVPAHALSRLFRERFKAALRRLLPEACAAVPDHVWQIDWVVDIRNVGNGEHALKYLTRYIYRVALTDSAILRHDHDSVTFRYRDSDSGRSRKMTLPAFEFLHRFLQHVLPKGFVKVRYYGLHHPVHRRRLFLARAQLCFRLNQPIPVLPPPSPKPPPRCRHCQAILVPDTLFQAGSHPPTTGPPGAPS